MDRILLEDGSGGYLLEDGSGVLLLESAGMVPAGPGPSGGSAVNLVPVGSASNPKPQR